MKKLLLLVAVIATGSYAYSQVVVAGVSPASIQGNYGYGHQANCGAWPGETDDATWGYVLDFNVPGTFVQDTLMMAEDGTPGLNLQGNPVSQEACFPLQNDLTGKIAVLYRNTCDFASKAWNAQVAGAVAVIVINREDDVALGMSADPLGDGPNVTIPVVIVSNISGAALVAEMANGPVEMFIGNKIGAFTNDIGAVKGEFLVAPYGGNYSGTFNGFDLGLQVYNYGTAAQATVSVNASIDGATAGNVYDETITLNMAAGDTAFIFPGNTDEFPAFDLGGVGNYTNDDYTITYSMDLGGTDDFDFDNVYTSVFKLQDVTISSSRLDAANMPVATTYPSNSTTSYEACMFVEDDLASSFGEIEGMYFIPHTDTAVNPLAGTEIFINAYQWDDAWVDLNDTGFDFGATTTDAYNSLSLLAFGTHYPSDDNEVDQVAYATFDTPFEMQDGTRYLFCAQTYESATVSFGWDNASDYSANYSIYAMPVSPIFIDGSRYTAGWAGGYGPSFALKQNLVGLDEANILEGKAFPNPANDMVTISLDANGAANLQVTDVAGKVAMSNAISLVNGSTNVDMTSLESGVYIFTVTLENGLTSQFNVIKK